MLLGIFVTSQIIKDALEIDRRPEALQLGAGRSWMRLRDWRRHWGNILRSSVIGTWIGILPGVGASISSMVAYGVTRNLSKTPEEIRHRQRGGHRRLGGRQQRQCRRRADPADHHGHPRQPDRRDPPVGADPAQHPARTDAVPDQRRLRLVADRRLSRRQRADVRHHDLLGALAGEGGGGRTARSCCRSSSSSAWSAPLRCRTGCGTSGSWSASA